MLEKQFRQLPGAGTNIGDHLRRREGAFGLQPLNECLWIARSVTAVIVNRLGIVAKGVGHRNLPSGCLGTDYTTFAKRLRFFPEPALFTFSLALINRHAIMAGH